MSAPNARMAAYATARRECANVETFSTALPASIVCVPGASQTLATVEEGEWSKPGSERDRL